MNGRTAKMLRRVAAAIHIPMPKDWKAPMEGYVAKSPKGRMRRRLFRGWRLMSSTERAKYRVDSLPLNRLPSHDQVHESNLQTIPRGPHFYHDLNRAQRRALDHDQGVFEQRRQEQAAEEKRLTAKADKERREKAKKTKLQDGKISLGKE